EVPKSVGQFPDIKRRFLAVLLPSPPLPLPQQQVALQQFVFQPLRSPGRWRAKVSQFSSNDAEFFQVGPNPGRREIRITRGVPYFPQGRRPDGLEIEEFPKIFSREHFDG